MTVSGARSTRERHWVCAQRLRERRLALGLTQREVVGRLPGGGSHPTNRALSAMENGRGLDLGMLPEFAETLDCTVTYLLGLTDDPHSWHPDRWHGIASAAPTDAAASSSDPSDRYHGHTRPAPTPGILGPNLPAGFVAPGRARRRGPAAAP